MYKTIVVATDGSERSMRVAGAAGKLACKHPGCKVDLIYVINELPGFVTSMLDTANIKYDEQMKGEAQKIFYNTIQALGIDIEQVDTHTHLRYGKPAKEIVSLANELKADLIVIGNSSASEAEEFLTGAGISHKILHHAPCNVMIVK